MRIIFFSFLCLFSPLLWSAEAPAFLRNTSDSVLTAEQAFQVKLAQVDNQGLTLQFNIAPGTYLYEKAFRFHSPSATFGSPRFPTGEQIDDPFFGSVHIFRHNLVVHLPIESLTQSDIELNIAYQGCNDRGFCYPPQQTTLAVNSGAPNPSSQAQDLLETLPKSWALAAFFGFGLLLAFTPCVLPMVPILSALIIGEQHKHHRGHALRLALTYVFSMATAYALLGATVASLGARVQAHLQHPIALSLTAGILIIMAILLFNDKAMAAVSHLNGPLHRLSEKLHTGRTVGVMMMGFISALVVSPCVTPPLIGALTYISTTGNILMGASALFALALGMGTPLLIVSWGGTALLPKRGPWLNYVKHAFAVILLLMAASLIARFAAPNWDWREPFGRPEQASYLLPFMPIQNPAQLDKALAQAKQAGKPVLIDFTADWCANCIVLERTVFPDPLLSSLWPQVTLLKVDVTDYHPDTQALMSQFQVYGPPALVFFDAQGRLAPQARVDGLVTPEALAEKIEQLLRTSS